MAYKMRMTEAEAIGRMFASPLTGRAECVAFVQQAAGAPLTSLWKRGVKVSSASPGQIQPGTAIATFDANGSYPSDNLGKHAAIYLSHTTTYILVLDQWAKLGFVGKREIKFNVTGKSRSNDGNTFYVIE